MGLGRILCQTIEKACLKSGLNKSRHRITEPSVDSMAASLPAQEQDCTLVKGRQLARCEYRVQPAYAPLVVYFNMDRISGCSGSG